MEVAHEPLELSDDVQRVGAGNRASDLEGAPCAADISDSRVRFLQHTDVPWDS